MMNPHIQSYEVKTSKTGHPIPVINSVHLHSIYNPEKEAENFINKNETLLKDRSHILILGLGFAYHVEEAIKRMIHFHEESFSIAIIEPNSETIKKFHALGKKLINTEIFCSDKVSDLYGNKKLTNFLLQKPGILPHPASFNLYNDFFKNYLSYNASTDITDICNSIESNELKAYFENLTGDIRQIATHIKRDKEILDSDIDFFMLAYDELCPDQKHDGL